MQDDNKKQARALLIKAKVYSVMGTAFAVIGIVVFLILFGQYFHGDFMAALKDPMIIVFIIFPFAPAILLSLKGKKAEKELSKLLKSDEGAKKN